MVNSWDRVWRIDFILQRRLWKKYVMVIWSWILSLPSERPAGSIYVKGRIQFKAVCVSWTSSVCFCICAFKFTQINLVFFTLTAALAGWEHILPFQQKTTYIRSNRMGVSCRSVCGFVCTVHLSKQAFKGLCNCLINSAFHSWCFCSPPWQLHTSTYSIQHAHITNSHSCAAFLIKRRRALC